VCTASRTMLNTGAFVNRSQDALKSKPAWSEYMKEAGSTPCYLPLA